eukprot:2125776-Pyramimonas_sp.AAC.3
MKHFFTSSIYCTRLKKVARLFLVPPDYEPLRTRRSRASSLRVIAARAPRSNLGAPTGTKSSTGRWDVTCTCA